MINLRNRSQCYILTTYGLSMVLKTLCPNQVPTSHPGTFFIASSSASRVARAALQSSLSRSAHKSGSMASSALRSSVMSRRQSFLLSTYHKWAKISYTTKPAIRGPPASQNLRYSWDPNQRTCEVFKWLKVVRLSNDQVFRSPFEFGYHGSRHADLFDGHLNS